MQKSRVLVALLTVAFAAGLTGCSGSGAGTGATGEIRIGASLELSGSTASIGTVYKKAMELKVEQINKAGGIRGRKLKLIVKDNQSSPAEGLNNVNAFTETDKVSVILAGGCSACIVNGRDRANSKKVPVIALAAASTITNPVADNKFMFKISANPAEDADAIIRELAQKKIRKVGVITVRNVYGQDGRTQFSTKAAAAGIEVVDAEEFNPDDKEMTGQVARIMTSKPDAVVTWSVMPAVGVIAQELKDANFKGNLYLGAGAGAELFIKGTQGLTSDNTYMVFPSVLVINDLVATTPQAIAQKAWFRDYSSRYGSYSGFASFGADAIQMVANAVQKTDSTDPERLRDEFEIAELDGMSGPIKMSPLNHSGLQADALKLLVIKNGEWRLAS